LKRAFARTFELCEGTLKLFRERRDVEGVAWSLLNLAAALLYSGHLAMAEERLDECLTWSRAAGFKEGIAWSLNFLGLVFRARGDANAADVLKDSLRMHWSSATAGAPRVFSKPSAASAAIRASSAPPPRCAGRPARPGLPSRAR